MNPASASSIASAGSVSSIVSRCDRSLSVALPRAKAHGRPLPTWNSSVSSIRGPLFRRPPMPSPPSLAAVRGQSILLPSTPKAQKPATHQQPSAATSRTAARKLATTNASIARDASSSAATKPW